MVTIPFQLAPKIGKPMPHQFHGPASVPGDWWKDLAIYIPMWERSVKNTVVNNAPVGIFDVVTGIELLFLKDTNETGTAIVPVEHRFGQGFPIGNAAGALDRAFGAHHGAGVAAERLNNAANTGGANHTLLVRGQSFGGDAGFIAGHMVGTTNYSYGIYRAGADDLLLFYGAAATIDSTYNWTDATPVTIVLAISAAESQWYVMDDAGTFVTNDTGGITLTSDTSRQFILGGRHRADDNRDQALDSEIEVFGKWDRTLSSQECLALLLDPWAPVRSTQFVPAFVAAAVGGRLMSSLVGAGGLAGSGGIAGKGGGLAG